MNLDLIQLEFSTNIKQTNLSKINVEVCVRKQILLCIISLPDNLRKSANENDFVGHVVKCLGHIYDNTEISLLSAQMTIFNYD